MRRAVPAAVLALLLAASLAGCTTGSSGGSTAAGSSAGRAAADFQAGHAAAGKAAAVPSVRAVVTTAQLQLTDAHPIAVADRIRAIVEGAAGRVQTSQEDPTGRASADLTVRIPGAVFDRTLAAIERTGDVRDVSVDATDVTSRVTDYGVRIASLRTSIARLQQLLARADSSSALVELEGALTDRQTSLEELLAQQRTLSDQVADATLTVSVVVPAAAAPRQGPGDFAAGFVVGLQGLAQATAAVLIALGVALPWLVVLAAGGGVVVAVRRLVRRRSRASSA